MDLLSNVIVGTGGSSYFATVGLDLLFLAVRMVDGDGSLKDGVLFDVEENIRERLVGCKQFLVGYVTGYLCRCVVRGEQDMKAEAVLSDLERILGVKILFSSSEYPLLQCGGIYYFRLVIMRVKWGYRFSVMRMRTVLP